MRETWVWSLGSEDPLEKGKATQNTSVFWLGEFHGLYSPFCIVHGVTKSWTRLSDSHMISDAEHVSMCLFSCGSDGEESVCNALGLGSISGSGRYLGEENGNPTQYPCLENSLDRGAWWATLYGISKSQTVLSNWHFHFHWSLATPVKMSIAISTESG